MDTEHIGKDKNIGCTEYYIGCICTIRTYQARCFTRIIDFYWTDIPCIIISTISDVLIP